MEAPPNYEVFLGDMERLFRKLQDEHTAKVLEAQRAWEAKETERLAKAEARREEWEQESRERIARLDETQHADLRLLARVLLRTCGRMAPSEVAEEMKLLEGMA